MPRERVVHKLAQQCACGGVAEGRFAEELRRGRLIWWESWHCSGCGATTEGDGADRLSDELRVVVLQAEGAFRVDLAPRNKLAVMRILRTTFAMALADAAATYACLPHGFRTGLTRTEAEWVAGQFPDDVAVASIHSEDPDRVET